MLFQCSKCNKIKHWHKFGKRQNRKFNFGLHYWCNECRNVNNRKNRISYKKYWNIKKKTGELIKEKEKRINSWISKDILNFAGIKSTNSIYFDIYDKSKSKKISIEFDREDIKNMEKFEKLFGIKKKQLIRLIFRIFCSIKLGDLSIK